MTERQVSISTRQASEMLGVHESSVKRWCNAGELECWLTPGGHRRIPVVALVAFAQRQNLALSLSPFGKEAGRVWAALEQAHQQDDYEALADLTYGWIEQGRRRLPTRLIEYLGTEGVALGTIMDRLVGPVMRRIGTGYMRGTVSIGDEHQMTQAMRDALVRLRPGDAFPEQPDGPAKPVAVVGCARNEVHELGALMVRLVLEAEGWTVVYLGLNVPTEEFAAQQIKHGATLLCISLMPPIGKAEAQTILRLLNQMYDPARPYRLAFGGSGLNASDNLDRTGLSIPDIQLFRRMEPFIAWVRDEF